MSQALTTHCAAFKSCKRYIKSVPPSFTASNSELCRVPAIAYAERMASKSTPMVLDVTDDDPATSHGMTSVLLKLLEYSPTITPCGEVRKTTGVNGDQGFVAISRKQVACRVGEEEASQRLSCLLPMPQDWHACKVQSEISNSTHPQNGMKYLLTVQIHIFIGEPGHLPKTLRLGWSRGRAWIGFKYQGGHCQFTF